MFVVHRRKILDNKHLCPGVRGHRGRYDSFFFTIVHSEDNFTTKVIVPNIALLKLLKRVVVMMVFNFFSTLELIGETNYRFLAN